jgi:hypothetical protein
MTPNSMAGYAAHCCLFLSAEAAQKVRYVIAAETHNSARELTVFITRQDGLEKIPAGIKRNLCQWVRSGSALRRRRVGPSRTNSEY